MYKQNRNENNTNKDPENIISESLSCRYVYAAAQQTQQNADIDE